MVNDIRLSTRKLATYLPEVRGQTHHSDVLPKRAERDTVSAAALDAFRVNVGRILDVLTSASSPL